MSHPNKWGTIRDLSSEIVRLYCEENLSSLQIAKKMGCSFPHICRILRKHKVIRSPTEAIKLAYTSGRLKSCMGEHHPNWRGGRGKTSGGYLITKVAPGHPYARKYDYILEHRLVMEQKLNRYLLPSEKVHHLNGIKDDNRPENLQLLSSQAHIVRTQFCQNCELRKEIRLLRWQLKELLQEAQGKIL